MNEELIERLNKNVEVFKDTQERISKDYIDETVSKTIIYSDKDDFTENERNFETKIKVISKDTISTIIDIKCKNPYNHRIGVLNFCDAIVPGGSVEKGTNAQEEFLCRCTSLFPILKSDKCFINFYLLNKKSKAFNYENRLIYSPDIQVLKDGNFHLLEDVFLVDVLSMAAPCLIHPDRQFNYGLTYSSHLVKDKLILNVALFNKITILILGAFGCGCFYNNPIAVAKVFKTYLDGEFKNKFKQVIFAIPYSKNYEIFKEILGEMKNE